MFFSNGSFLFHIEGIKNAVLNDIETANNALTSTYDVLNIYIDVLQHAVPWDAFNRTLNELDKYQKDYSKQSAALIGHIKSLMSEGIDAYNDASKHILKWCDEATPLLTTYVDLFENDHTVEKAFTQKDILVVVLGKGVTEMKSAQAEIKQGSGSFNVAVGDLTTLNSRLHFEFSEKSTYFKKMISDVRAAAYAGTGFFGLFGLILTAGMVNELASYKTSRL